MSIHVVQDQAARATLSPAETMRALGISRSTLNRYVDRGVLVVQRLPSGHRRFSASQISAMVSGEPWDAA